MARPGAEARVGAYWATRVGAVLIVLAAVFLAAYVSVFSAPIVRVAELLAAAVAAASVGYWQQGRGHLHFASALHSLADALLFFTAFAASAFPQMRLWSDPGPALAAQGVAALIVCAHGMQRRSQASATFGLALLGWAGGFALHYEHRVETLGFALLIAVLAATWRWRNGWRGPLVWASVTAPLLAAAVEGTGMIPAPLGALFFGGLPVLLGLPLILPGKPLEYPDRVCLLLMLALEALAALTVGSSQLLIDAVVFLVIAAALAARRGNLIERRLPFQAGYVAAITGAVYLFARTPEPSDAIPAILALGLAASAILSAEGDAVLPAWQLGFWAIAGLAEAHPLRFGTGQVWEPHVWWAVAAGLLAAVGCLRWRGLIWWPVAAEMWLHAQIAADVASSGMAPLAPLLAATVADAAALWFLAGWKGREVADAIKGMSAALMLAALFYGYSGIAQPHTATFIWIALALGAFVVGYVRNSPPERIAALAAFAACVARIFVADLHSAVTRIAAFFTLGAILIGIGYLYSRLQARRREAG